MSVYHCVLSWCHDSSMTFSCGRWPILWLWVLWWVLDYIPSQGQETNKDLTAKKNRSYHILYIDIYIYNCICWLSLEAPIHCRRLHNNTITVVIVKQEFQQRCGICTGVCGPPSLLWTFRLQLLPSEHVPPCSNLGTRAPFKDHLVFSLRGTAEANTKLRDIVRILANECRDFFTEPRHGGSWGAVFHSLFMPRLLTPVFQQQVLD